MSANEPSSPVCYATETNFSPPRPLRLLILGAGAVGGYIGGRLLEAGADVTFLVRKQRLDRLRNRGLSIRSPLGNTCQRPRLATSADRSVEYDIVLLTCKAYDLDSAMENVAATINHRTRILPLLNGLAHFPSLDNRFGRERVMGGLAHLAVEQRDDGIHHLNDFHRIVFGMRHAGQKDHARRLHDLFIKTNLDTEYTESIEQALWNKFIFLTTLAGATCLFRASVGAILKSISGERFILNLLQECIAVASASGYVPAPETLADYRTLLTDRNADYTASMLRDMENGTRTEANHILGDMLRRAANHRIETEALKLAYSHLQVYEQRLSPN